MKNAVYILIGSGATADVKFLKGRGEILAIDSSIAVKELAAPHVTTFHLSPSPLKAGPSDIPMRFVDPSQSGSALVSANGYFAAHENSGLESEIQRKVVKGDNIFLRASEKGGTGNGLFRVVDRILSQTEPEGTVRYIHNFIPEINPEKEFQRLQDLHSGTLIGEHVLTRYEETVYSIYDLWPEIWDSIDEVKLNIKAKARHGGSLLLMKVVKVKHDEFVDDIVGSIQSSVRDRWLKGEASASTRDLKEERSTVNRLFEKLYKYTAMPLHLNGQVREMIRTRSREKKMQVVTTELELAKLDGQQSSGEIFDKLNSIISKVGYENVRDIFERQRELIGGEVSEIESDIETAGWDKVFGTPTKFQSFLRSFYPDGLERRVEKLLNREVQRARKTDVLTALDTNFTDRFTGLDGRNEFKYKLPEGHLKEELEKLLLEANDSKAGITLIRAEIKSRLGEFLLESLPFSLKNELEFDFRVDSSVEEAKGAVVESDVPALKDLAERLNYNLAQTKFIISGEGETTIVSFAVPRSLLDIYDLANLMKREGIKYKADKTKKFYVRRVHDMFKPPIRFEPAASPEDAAIALVKAFLTRNVLTVFRKNKSELTIMVNDRIVGYRNFAEFRENLPESDEISLHERFWDAFCADRAGILRNASAMAAADALTGEVRERFLALKALVGAEIWKKAIEDMLEQVRFANDSYK
ncbi:MAG: hypothetical protein M1378_01355 [Bacteroidetes bacterium]|nr:hypothetical protein [Bacteroidota bacterium]